MPNFLQKVWNFLEENPMSFGYRGSGGGGFQVGTNPSWLYLQQRRREMEEEERKEEVANRQKLRMTLAQAGVSPETIDRYVPISTERPVEYQSIGQLLGVKGRQAEAAKTQATLIGKAEEARQKEASEQKKRKEKLEDEFSLWLKKQQWERAHPKSTEAKPTEEEKSENKLADKYADKIRATGMERHIDLKQAFKEFLPYLPGSLLSIIADKLGLEGIEFVAVNTPEGGTSWQIVEMSGGGERTFHGATSYAEVEAAVAGTPEPERSQILEEARRFFGLEQVPQSANYGGQQGIFQATQQAR